jgi:hypothetical protein
MQIRKRRRRKTKTRKSDEWVGKAGECHKCPLNSWRIYPDALTRLAAYDCIIDYYHHIYLVPKKKKPHPKISTKKPVTWSELGWGLAGTGSPPLLPPKKSCKKQRATRDEKEKKNNAGGK